MAAIYNLGVCVCLILFGYPFYGNIMLQSPRPQNEVYCK